jgi:hypothetical protein
MARIDWILKDTGPGQMGDVVSHQAGVIRAVHHVAQDRAAVARGYLEAHRTQSDKFGHSYISVTRGDVDSFVNLNDERSQEAAAAIEFGNKYGGGGVDVLGRAFGLT